MNFVITLDSDVECPDQGRATIVSSERLTISAKAVVAKLDLVGAAIGGCLQVPPPQTNIACIAIVSCSSGESTKLTVGSKPVMLNTLAAASAGQPKNQIVCKDARQTKVTAI
jgi:hypothetical protein